MKLFEIASEYEHLLENLCDPETGEINEQSLALLNNTSTELDKKFIAVASFIKNMDAEREAIAQAKKAMAARETSFATKVENLLTYLQINMERTGKTEISCPYFSIKLKKCPVSVDVIDEAAITDEYKKVKEVISIDKIKLKSDMQAGIAVTGATLKQNTRLEIR